MTQINISIKPSLAAIQKAYGNAGITQFLSREIERVTFKIVRFAKQVTPVDTGLLRASIGGGAFKVDTGKGPANFKIQVSQER